MRDIPRLSQRWGSGIMTDDDEIEPSKYKYISPEVKERIHNKRWETQDGRNFKISDMDTIHILTTINFIKRHHNTNEPAYKEYLRLFNAELHRRDPETF